MKDFVGLSASAVVSSRAQHGDNSLPPPETETFWEKLKGNFDDPLIRILCAALGVTCALAAVGYANIMEGIGIAVAVVLATFVATYSEYKNEENFQNLQMQASKVKNSVFRDGNLLSIEVNNIVVGDEVLLQAGDKIPADGVLVAGHVGVDQSSLTGENEPVQKSPRDGFVEDDYGAALSLSNENCCFRGSAVDNGEGVMVVLRVGSTTVYGAVAEQISHADGREAPLQTKLAKLADGVAKLGYYGAISIALSFLFKQFVMDPGFSFTATVAYASNWQVALHDVVTSVILAIIVVVVAVPEGLPMMIAMVLSFNMRKLLKAEVLVRRLLGIETAGCMDILFSDKTGTLTEGEFLPEVFLLGNGNAVVGLSEMSPRLAQTLELCLRGATKAMVSKSSNYSVDMDGGSSRGGVNLVGGNASDRAMLRFLPSNVLLGPRPNCSTIGEVLFTSVLKFSATALSCIDSQLPSEATGVDVETGATTVVIYKGAAEIIMKYCTHYYSADGSSLMPLDTMHSLTAEIDHLASEGARFIAVATSTAPLVEGSTAIPPGLALVGVMGLRDRVRPESAQAVAMAEKAGIHVVMITGDRVETAISIAQTVGLLKAKKDVQQHANSWENSSADVVLTSDEMGKLSDDQLRSLLGRLRVVARAMPADKSRLVEVAQSARFGRPGHVVGMTGDGINDTAALKLADVSFAMGAGAEIAKEASDVVIMNNNFQAILQASLYGRTIFRSIRKFIVFQSTINLASTLIVFVGPFLGFDFPLTLIQLLWVNLVMDTLAALAFGGAPALLRYMKEKPVRREDAIITPKMWSAILVTGSYIAIACICFLTTPGIRAMFDRVIAAPSGEQGANVEATARHETPQEIDNQGGEVFLTAFFCFFIFICTLNAFNVRTESVNLMENITGNHQFAIVIMIIFVVQVAMTEFGGSFLRTVPLTRHEWLLVCALASSVVPFDVLRKSCLNMMAPPSMRGVGKME